MDRPTEPLPLNPLEAIDEQFDKESTLDANFQHLRYMFEGYRAHTLRDEEDHPYPRGSARDTSWCCGKKLAHKDLARI